MNEEKNILIKYRINQANESIEEARILRREGMSRRSVINRLYYAMFYSVLAVLQKKEIGTSKHISAISLFDREFVKTGIFAKELSKTLHRAFELRQKADYMEQTEITDEDLNEIFPETVHFVHEIEKYVLE